MKVPIIIKYGIPALSLLGLYQVLVIMQTGDPVIDFLAPIVPYLGEFLNFFAQILVPIGEALADTILGPLIKLLPPDTGGGLAIYFIIFAFIFMIALYLNVIWKPRGWGQEKDREKEEESEGVEFTETIGESSRLEREDLEITDADADEEFLEEDEPNNDVVELEVNDDNESEDDQEDILFEDEES